MLNGSDRRDSANRAFRSEHGAAARAAALLRTYLEAKNPTGEGPWGVGGAGFSERE